MVILTLNCGSSSAKYQVYDWDNKDVLTVGVVERIGQEYSTIEQKSRGKEEFNDKFSSPTHAEAIDYILDDELIEVTPKSIRLRKKILQTDLRLKDMMRRRRELEAKK